MRRAQLLPEWLALVRAGALGAAPAACLLGCVCSGAICMEQTVCWVLDPAPVGCGAISGRTWDPGFGVGIVVSVEMRSRAKGAQGICLGIVAPETAG